MFIPALRRPQANNDQAITEMVVWSRMQAEAGQDLSAIVARKECERVASGGVFCWGVGNAPSRAMPALARSRSDVDVVFSIMKSRPKAADANPDGLVVWRSYFDGLGVERPLPAACLVTSRAGTGTKPKETHYALMCTSGSPLVLGDFGAFDHRAYRNVSEAGGAIGASQVTALLKRAEAEHGVAEYRINLRAKLTLGYWVRLGNPLDLDPKRREFLETALRVQPSTSTADWLTFVDELRKGNRRQPERLEPQLVLL
ncbi:MAG: hypothetical protein ACXU82_17400 [Caulobacteraceae bacterium]